MHATINKECAAITKTLSTYYEGLYHGDTSGLEEPDGELNLRTALALALEKSPRLSALAENERMAEASRIQAGLLPNPELAYEVENEGGSLDGEAESTVSISMLPSLKRRTAAR